MNVKVFFLCFLCVVCVFAKAQTHQRELLQAAPAPFGHRVAVLATEKSGRDRDGSASAQLTGRTGSGSAPPPEKENNSLLHDAAETAPVPPRTSQLLTELL